MQTRILAARQAGMSVESARALVANPELASAIEAKLISNMARCWPAPMDGEPCEHVRVAEGGANG